MASFEKLVQYIVLTQGPILDISANKRNTPHVNTYVEFCVSLSEGPLHESI